MEGKAHVEPRLVIISILAIAILMGLVFATGGGLSSSSSSSAIASPTIQPTATAAPAGQVRGSVTSQVRHTAGHTWHFVYTVHNSGTVPIAGFQINAPQSNLFHVSGPAGWSFYGSGICAGKQQGVLVYWSTSNAAATIIQPKHSAVFAFDVNTSGSGVGTFSLSSGVAQPYFSKVVAPAPSTMAATGRCG